MIFIEFFGVYDNFCDLVRLFIWTEKFLGYIFAKCFLSNSDIFSLLFLLNS